MTVLRVFVGLLILLLGVAVFKFLPPMLVADGSCSPTAVRPWAAADYDARVSSAPVAKWPTVTSGVRPKWVTLETPPPEGPSFSLTFDSKPEVVQPSWSLFERVPVLPGMVASLPGASGFTAELLYWRWGTGPWLSPVDGEPLEVQPKRRIEPQPHRGFTFAVRFKGGALRAHGASLFDTATKAPMANGSSWRRLVEDDSIVEFQVGTEVHHRSNLMLEVPVTYGPERIKVLDCEKQSKVRFGSACEVEFLLRGPGGITSSYAGQKNQGFKWDPKHGTQGAGWAAIYCYPPEAVNKIQGRALGSTRWESIHGPTQLPVIRDVPVASEGLEVRYLPHAARLQFELPLTSTLPVVEDLFAVDMGTLELGGQWALSAALAECLQLDRSGFHELNLDAHTFPMTIENATPKRLLQIVLEKAPPKARVDLSGYFVTTDNPSLAARIGEWLGAQAKKLGL